MVRNRNRTLLLAVDTHSALDKQSHYVQLSIMLVLTLTAAVALETTAIAYLPATSVRSN